MQNGFLFLPMSGMCQEWPHHFKGSGDKSIRVLRGIDTHLVQRLGMGRPVILGTQTAGTGHEISGISCCLTCDEG